MKKTKGICANCRGRIHYDRFCAKCFSRHIEKRARIELKDRIRRGGTVTVVGRPALFIVKKVVSFPIKIRYSASVGKLQEGVVLSDTSEKYISDFFSGFFAGKIRFNDRILPFRNVTEDELVAYLQLNNVRYAKKKYAVSFDSFTNYPETIHSLSASIDSLCAIFKSNDKL